MSCNNKKVMLLVINHSLSQKCQELDLFLSNFENLIIDMKNRKPYLSAITGDFNARSSSWWSNDMNATEGAKLFVQTSSDEFQQLIKKPTHIQKYSSSCIDLILTDEPNMSVNYEVHASFHLNCFTIKLFIQVLLFILPALNQINS